MTVEFEGLPFEEEAAQVIAEFMTPNEELGWEGVPWFTGENATEVAFLWDRGFVLRRAV